MDFCKDFYPCLRSSRKNPQYSKSPLIAELSSQLKKTVPDFWNSLIIIKQSAFM